VNERATTRPPKVTNAAHAFTAARLPRTMRQNAFHTCNLKTDPRDALEGHSIINLYIVKSTGVHSSIFCVRGSHRVMASWRTAASSATISLAFLPLLRGVLAHVNTLLATVLVFVTFGGWQVLGLPAGFVFFFSVPAIRLLTAVQIEALPCCVPFCGAIFRLRTCLPPLVAWCSC
jgi:hypothetical protein